MTLSMRTVGLRTVVGVALMVALLGSFSLASPAPAAAASKHKPITRKKVMARANNWVKRRVPYSQSRHYQGYRQDCSGFVSMAWALPTSYTSRTISRAAKRIRIRDLKPGDAVHTPGHVAIFGGWANRSRTKYVALEESTWGKPALKRVRPLRANAKALRRHAIVDKAKPKKKPAKHKKVVVITRKSAPRMAVTAATRSTTSGLATASIATR